MKILGNSFQETEPTPDKPTEIKNENYIFGNIDGQPINIPYNPKVERLKYFQKVNGKWHAVFEPLKKE